MGAPVTLVGTDGAYVALPPRSMAIPENAQTYSAAFSSYAAYATPTDLMTLTGSATKTVAVTGFAIGIQSTASALQTLDLIRRSAASTGGTATTLTPVLYDSEQAAATAVAKIWTAAPSLGASAGTLKTIVAASSTLTIGPTMLGLNFTNNTLQSPQISGDFRRPVILRGAAESINLNYKGAALTAGFAACGFIEWIEFDE
jgi:hypothetical protein